MAWFLYNGLRPKPVPTGDGNVVAVRPQSKIEIKNMTPAAQALVNKGELIRTSAPKDKIERAPADPIVEPRKSSLADWVAEKGHTPSRGLPPKRADGKVELTDGEQFATRVVVAVAEPPVVPAVPEGEKAQAQEEATKESKGFRKNRGR